MERYLIIKTRDELLRIRVGQILYFEADRNYTKLLLSSGIQFTFAINIGKIEEILEKQVAGSTTILMRVGKSHIINKNHILQINIPKQRLLLLTNEGKPKELTISRDPLKALKDSFEKEMLKTEEVPAGHDH
jgi:DNA-binding LytR/AlgR family response regulator